MLTIRTRYRRVICWFVVVQTLLLGTTQMANAGEGRRAVWIDTDPACGTGVRDDVDDCFALLYALQSEALRVVGISSVFGNADLRTVTETLDSLLGVLSTSPLRIASVPQVHTGAAMAGNEEISRGTAASYALGEALQMERLTVIALGPLTNVASLITRHPELVDRVDAVVAVAGTRPGRRLLRPGNTRLLHFHDLNFKLDPAAFEAVLRSGVPLVLLPFDASERIHITSEDLQRLRAVEGASRWLAEMSEGWLSFWTGSLGAPGFRPFDSLAVGWVASPEYFSCAWEQVRIRARRSLFISRDSLEVAASVAGGRPVLYCDDLSLAFKADLLARLTSLTAPSRPQISGAVGSKRVAGGVKRIPSR